jgi:hypothetical protein
VTVLVASVCLGYLDGSTFNVNSRRPQYREVDGSVAHATFYALVQSDITTAVSLAATITRVAGGWWATGYIWRSAFVAMERGGISAKGLSQAISNRPPAPHHFTRKSSMVIIYIALFATFATDYFSAALTGSFVWEAAIMRIPGRIPLTGITGGAGQDMNMQSAAVLYQSSNSSSSSPDLDWQRLVVAMGFAYAMVAWGTLQSDSILNVTEPSAPFRRVIQGAQYIPTNSTLTKIIMPYFAPDAFEWVQDPYLVLTERQKSLLTPAYDGYNPFVTNVTGGLLPDTKWGTGPPIPTSGPLPVSESRLFAFLIYIDLFEVGSSSSCPQNYTIDPGSQIKLFTPVQPTSVVSAISCFAIANVSYRAGVISCESCQVISPNVVEAQAPFSLLGDFFTSDALGMVPFLGTQLLLSNSTIPLNYGTLRNLAIELTSRAYQAAWAAMSDLLLLRSDTTAVQIALPTLRAKVIHWRVYLWVVLHLWVLTLGLLFTYFQRYCDHPWVEDPTMAVFWLDTRAVLTDSEGQGILDPWQPETEIHEGEMLILEQNEGGQRSVQVKMSSGSRQRSVQVERSSGSRRRRYSNSIPLQHRMPPSSSTILGEECRESVEPLIGTSVPTTLHTSSSEPTGIPENCAE